MLGTQERILISRGGWLQPRLEQAPLLSSAGNGWNGVLLEQHSLYGPSESKGVIDGFQICCNLSGPVSAEWLVDSSWRGATLHPGDLCLATHGEFRSVAWQSPYELLLLSLSPLLIGEASAEAGQVRPLELIPQRAFRDDNVESICRLLLSDAAAGSLAGPLYGEHLACSLAAYLTRHFGTTGQPCFLAGSRLPGPVLKRICELIEARLNTRIGLEDLAREAHMSRFHFSRMFRNSTGESPYRYLIKRRVERAKEMLATGASDDQVAAGSGFSSRSHLCSFFRKYAGITPRKFRSLFD